MKVKIFLRSGIVLLVIYLFTCDRTTAQNKMPTWLATNDRLYQQDWLVRPVSQKAAVFASAEGKDIILYNGLLKRTFRIRPNVTCIDYKNMSTGQQLLRAVKPEARIKINGKAYNIGGLYGQKENAYLLTDLIDQFAASENDFQFQSYSISEISPYIQWKPGAWARNKHQPSGKELTFKYSSGAEALKGLVVSVHYELYDGIPLIVKWLSVENQSPHLVKLNRVVNEILGIVEEESYVVGKPEQTAKQHGLYVETNYAFNNAMTYSVSDQTTHWKTDSAYSSQVNYNYQTPCLLEVYPESGPGVELKPGKTFRSVRTQELLMDSYDRERRGLAIRKMYSILAPWTTENPIFMHLVSKDDEQVKRAIDQCVATGYEMLILSFGSHCHIEDTSAANILKWKTLADLAHRKGIKMGGYSLFSSRRISDADDVIDPVTGKPDAAAFFGLAPCLGSNWGLAYLEKLRYFISHTGFNLLEHDGPYPGDLCASTTHPGHKGLDDSQWKQMELQKGLYRWCNEHDVYVNAPDWYYLDGTNKSALGYREVNFALPRANQKILNRQNIYDGTWEKTVSMVWGFVPLTEYHEGDSASVLEPLSEHLKDYEQLMMQYYGAGIQACYRGPRLYDSDSTRETVIRVIKWYKKYRDILNADVIHLRRADGRDWDGIMHVGPLLKEKALVMLYNPLKYPVSRPIDLPLYYTGLKEKAKVREKEGAAKTYTLDRQYHISVNVNIPAEGYTWLVIN